MVEVAPTIFRTETVAGAVFRVFQAEHALLDGAAIVTAAEQDRGADGDAFVDFVGSRDQTVSWVVDIEESGVYGLDVIYALAQGRAPRPMTLSVDGVAITTLDFTPNSDDSWAQWGSQAAALALEAGRRVITVTAPNGDGPNIDALRLTAAPRDVAAPLGLTVIDASDPAAVLFEATGLPADGAGIAVSLDGGATSQPVVPDALGRFTLDLRLTPGARTVTLLADGESVAAAVEVPAPAGDGVETVDGVAYRIHEAERADLDGAVVVPGGVDDRGASGEGFVDYRGREDQTIAWTVDVAEDGFYRIDVIYQLVVGKSARPMALSVNGVAVETLAFAPNAADESEWGPQSTLLSLTAGVNVIALTAPRAVGPDVDYLRVALAPEGGGEDVLALSVIDASDAAAVVFAVAGLPDPAAPLSVSLDGGATAQPVAPDALGRFTLDLAYTPGPQTLTLLVGDAAPAQVSVALEVPAPAADGVTQADGVDYLVFEAERADLDGAVAIATASDDRGASGDGYVDFKGSGDQTITWTIEVPEDGVYRVDIGYQLSLGGRARPMALSVDGVVIETLAFAPNANVEGPDTQWGPQSTLLSLTAGVHRIAVTAPNAFGPNVDWLRVAARPESADSDAVLEVRSLGLDAAVFDDHLAFSIVERPLVIGREQLGPRSNKDTGLFEIRNGGTDPLEIFSGVIDGPFVLVEPAALDGLTLAPGEAISVTVRFDPDIWDEKPTSTDWEIIDEQQVPATGSLSLLTNAAPTPQQVLTFGGHWQLVNEFGMEATVNEVWAITGFGNHIEGLPNVEGGARSIFSPTGEAIAIDETEIISPYWRVADGHDAVTFTNLADYSGPGSKSLFIHAPGDRNATIRLIRTDAEDSQRVLATEGDAPARATLAASGVPAGWIGDGVFGLRIDGYSSDPRLNNLGDQIVDGVQLGLYVKIFQALDAQGNVIPDTWLIIQDVNGLNSDYNDTMWVMQGAAPVGFGARLAAPDALIFDDDDAPADPGLTRSVVIANQGVAPLTILDVAIEGADAADFAIVSGLTAGQSIEPGASTTVTLSYTGPGRETAEATLAIASNDGPVAIALTAPPDTVLRAGDDAYAAASDAPFTVDAAEGLLANDRLGAGEGVVVSVNGAAVTPGAPVEVAGSQGGLFRVGADGAFTFDPDGDFDGLGDGQAVATEISYAIRGADGLIDSAWVTVGVSADGTSGAAGAGVLRSGVLTVGQAGPGAWTVVSFGAPMRDPSVVASLNTLNDGAPATLRIRNVTATGFEIQIDEWDNLDGVHGVERISWVAVEKGVHRLAGGLVIEAGSTTGDEATRTVSFAAGFDAAPVVFGGATTANEPSALTARLSGVTDAGFAFRLQQQESETDAISQERVDWIAVSTGDFGALVAGSTDDTVTDAQSAIGFGREVGPVGGLAMLAAMQTTDGGDTATVRGAGVAASGATVFVEEETSRDSETGHTTERVGWLALDGARAAALGGGGAAPVGLLAEFWATPDATSLDAIDFAAAPVQVARVTSVDYPNTGGSFWEGGAVDRFAARFSGEFEVATAGTYTFSLTSDDGSVLYVDGAQVIDNDAVQAPTTKTATLSLAAGAHDIELRYFERTIGAALDLKWQGPGTGGLQTMTFGAQRDPSALRAEFHALGANPGALEAIAFDGQPTRVERLDRIDLDAGVGALWQGGPSDNVAIRFIGPVEVRAAGDYTFFLRSDDGSELYVNGQRVVDNDALQAVTEKSATLSLGRGTHMVEVRYFEAGGFAEVGLDWQGPDTGGQRETTVFAAAGESVAAPAASRPVDATSSFSMIEDAGPVALAIPTVDADGDALRVVSVDQPANGVARLAAHGVLTYAPEAEFNGTDSFVYIAADAGGETTVGRVNLTVKPGYAQPQSALVPAIAPEIDAAGQALILRQVAELPNSVTGAKARANAVVSHEGDVYVTVEGNRTGESQIYRLTDDGAGGYDVALWLDAGAAIAAAGFQVDNTNVQHGGVRSLAFHPDFATNGKIYLSVMLQRPADPASPAHRYLSDVANPVLADGALVEFTVDPDTGVLEAGSYREVFRVGMPVYDHPVKQIAFNPFAAPGDADYGMLYVAHGDGSVQSATAGGGQNADGLGKIFRIDPLQNGDDPYRVPADNPFVGDPSMLDEVYALGFRNPHNLSFARAEDGSVHLISTEIGRDNFDEINIVVAGGDYGWSQREGMLAHAQAQGAPLVGVSPLPENEANFGYVYPAAFLGHDLLTGHALAGGFVLDNGGELDGQFVFGDFTNAGRMFMVDFAEMLAADTTVAPGEVVADALTWAEPGELQLYLDHDGDPGTLPIAFDDFPSLIGSNRADFRFGAGPSGELLVVNKRDGFVYVADNTRPVDDPFFQSTDFTETPLA
jgi:hypothetical protein